MKNVLSIITLLTFFFAGRVCAQASHAGLAWIEIKNGGVYWCEQPRNNNWLDQFSLIFEGHILADHRILVLKQFKGTFNSDTVTNINRDFGLAMQKDAFANIGDEAIFFVLVTPSGYNYYVLQGDSKGFLRVCDKPDAAKEVYEGLEKITGQKYVEVHPNSCATQH